MPEPEEQEPPAPAPDVQEAAPAPPAAEPVKQEPAAPVSDEQNAASAAALETFPYVASEKLVKEPTMDKLQEESAPPSEEVLLMATEEPKRRKSSGTKRASIDAKAVNQETFVPPSGDRRPSSGAKRVSVTEKSRRSSQAPFRGARPSKFGTPALSSKARMVLGSIVDIKVNALDYYDKKVAKFQNTYRLESENPFNPEKVDKILKEVMHEIMENLQYDPEKCASTAKFASSQIRSKVKQLEFDRYKLICMVTIGEKNSQDVYATCRFLWDSEKDRYSYYSMENTHVYGVACCFGLYYE